MEKLLLSWMCKIDATLSNHTLMLTSIAASTNSCSIIDVPSFDFAKSLPLKNQADVNKWEQYITSKENFEKAVKHLAVIGGSDAIKMTRRILKYLMTQELGSQYNWAGRGEKFPFKSLKTKDLIIYAIRENKLGFEVDENDIEETIKMWLKHSPFRMKYEINKNQIKL